MRRSLLAALLVSLAAVPAASASSLPQGRFGERPGPPLLYAKPPTVPELSVPAPFRARPLLISGTDAYRRGEYLYQDYLFDDHGADTNPDDFMTAERKPGPDTFSTASGDVLYPTGDAYRHNAADLVELRVRPTGDALLYRVTLNTVVDPSLPAVGVGIDTDAGTDTDRGMGDRTPVEWDNGAGLRSLGLDFFVTAWDGGGEVCQYGTGTTPGESCEDGGGETTPLPDGAVSLDPRTNQMTIRVPLSPLSPIPDPGTATWRHFAGVGLWDAAQERFKQVPPGTEADTDTPASGSPSEDAPAIFNLAFRFDEALKGEPHLADSFFEPRDAGVGRGNWYEAGQAGTLARPTSFRFHADIDFGRIAAGPDGFAHGPRRNQARILASGLDLPEGVSEGFPEFGGRLQPYLLRVPDELGPGRAGLTFSLHALGATYTQFPVFSPRQLRQFGDRRGNLVATPLGRGSDGWYMDEAEADFFEVWRDVASRFRLDPRRAYLTGYSMGGYGTYRLGVLWPDLFARAFTTVGPPGEGIWVPPAPPVPGGEVSNTFGLLENVRWVPYLNWVALGDEQVPYAGPSAQQDRFERLGLRSTLETFAGEHFTPALEDEWGAASDFLGRARVARRPSRVDYAFRPGMDNRSLGLVHDHAYWLTGLRARDKRGDPETDPARAEVSARSQAAGLGRPETEAVRTVATAGRPSPSVVRGTRWTGMREAPERNRITLRLSNIRRATVHGRGARLDGAVAREPLRVRLESDGRGRVRLELPLPGRAMARRIDGRPVPGTAGATSTGVSTAAARAPEVALDRQGARFTVARGEREYVIRVGDRDGRNQGGGQGDGHGDADGRRPGASAAGSLPAEGAGAAVGVGARDGALPFTGLLLAAVAFAGLAALGAGRVTRRLAR